MNKLQRILIIIGIWYFTISVVVYAQNLGVATRLRVPQGGTGFSSTSPNSILVTGNSSTTDLVATSSNPLWVGRIYATSTLGEATSTFTWGIDMGVFNLASTTATSTARNGINLIGGCFSISGTCVVSGVSGSGVANRIAFWDAATSLTSDAELTYSASGDALTLGRLLGTGTATSSLTGGFTTLGLDAPTFLKTTLGLFDVLKATSTTATSTLSTGIDITGRGLRVVGDARIDNLELSGNFIIGGSTYTDLDVDTTLDAISGGLRVVDVNCTDCLNATEIEDIYLFNNADDTTTGAVTMSRLLGSGTATSSLTGGLTTTILDASLAVKTTASFANTFHATSTSATSTFANGISLSGGCFANLSGDCIGGKQSPAINIASTTLGTNGKRMNGGTTTLLIKNSPIAFTLEGVYCKATSTAASTQIALARFYTGGTYTTTFSCNTTGSFTSFSSNNTFTSFQDFNLEASSSPQIDRITITTQIRETSD